MPNPAMDTGMPDVLFELENAEESLVLLWNTPKSKRPSDLKELTLPPVTDSPATGSDLLTPSPRQVGTTTPSSTRRRISTPKQFVNMTTSLSPGHLVTPSPNRGPFSPSAQLDSSSIKQSIVLSPKRRISTPKERTTSPPARTVISPEQSAPLSPRRRISTPKEFPVSPERSIVAPKQFAPLSPRRRISTPKHSPASPRRSVRSPKQLAPRVSTAQESNPISPKPSVISPRQKATLSPRSRLATAKSSLPTSPRRYITASTQETPRMAKKLSSTPQSNHSALHEQVRTPRAAAVSPGRVASPLVSPEEAFPVSPRRGQTEDRFTTPLNASDTISPTKNSSLRRPTCFSASRRSSASRESSTESPENQQKNTTPFGHRPFLSRRTSSPGNQNLNTPVAGATHRRASTAGPASRKRPSFLTRRSPAPGVADFSAVPRRGTSFHLPSTTTPTGNRTKRLPSFSTATPTVTPKNRFSLIRRSPALMRTPKETSSALASPRIHNNNTTNNHVLGRSVSKIKPIFNAVASTITSPGSNPIQPLRRSTSLRNNSRKTPVVRRMASFKSPSSPIEEAELIAAQLKQKAAFQKAEAADIEEELAAHKLEAAFMEAEANKILSEVRRASHTGTPLRSPNIQAYRNHVTVVKPFQLYSFRKHEEATRRREARVEDEEKELDRKRKFKARPMPAFYRR